MSEISGKQFVEWRAYDQLSPIGEERADLRNGKLCDWIGKLHGVKSTKPLDFMPFTKAPTQSGAEQRQLVQAAMAAADR